MHAIRIDRTKPLCDEPNCGHNRYHPDIAPAAEVGEGEEIALETRDALDGQITPATTVADFAAIDAGAVHPLTGPVFVKGAQPGDMLEIEFTDIIPQPTAFSAIMPGLGFLRDVMTEPFLVHWQLKDNWATSAQLPGVRIPGAPFMGVSAVAPSAEQLAAWTAREQRVIDAGGFALPPDAAGAVPAGPCGLDRPAHPAAARERRQFRREAADQGRQTVPAGVQGGRRCSPPATATSRRATARSASPRSRWAPPPWCASRCTRAWRPGGNSPRRCSRATTYFADPRFAAPERFLGVMGMPINAAGEIEAENLTLACRNAVLNMMELLQERGFSRQQAYVICSVAVDLRISNVVDVPELRRLGAAAGGDLRW